jgi:hypothetical protein
MPEAVVPAGFAERRGKSRHALWPVHAGDGNPPVAKPVVPFKEIAMHVPIVARSHMIWKLLAIAGIVGLAGGPEPASAAVSVSQKGQTLYVTGTRSDEWVYIIGVDGEPGVITIQSAGQPMTAHFGFQNLSVNLGGGNNVVVIVQVNLPGSLWVNGGSGINELFVGLEKYMPNLIWGDVNVSITGTSEIEMEQSWILGAANIDLGDAGNRVVIGRADTAEDLGAVILGGLTVETGAGADRIEVAKSWIVGGALFETAGGSDEVILGTHYETGSPVAGNIFDGNVTILTGAGEDGVGLTDCTFDDNVSIETGDDDDELYLGDEPEFPANSFAGEVDAHGGNGEDFLNDDPENAYADPPSFHSFELP